MRTPQMPLRLRTDDSLEQVWSQLPAPVQAQLLELYARLIARAAKARTEHPPEQDTHHD